MGGLVMWIALGVVAAIALLLVVIYNRLVALRQKRENAFSDIDVQLRQRYDLVPNLVNTVKGYATHEKELLEQVTEARSKAMAGGGGPAEQAQAEGLLGAAMMNLMAVAENYPDLKANQNFQQLQQELSDIENKIAAARRFFNNATSEYNTAIQQFPAVLIAGSFGFMEEEFFDMPDTERAVVSEAPNVTFD